MPRSRWETHIAPNIELIKQWARDGVIDKDIAKRLGVAYSTFRKYKAEEKELEEALRCSKEMADANVESALYRRAVGYRYTETKITRESGGVTEVETTREALPDTTAQIFWLKNRRPDKWRESQSIEITKPIDDTIKELEEYFNAED